MKVTTPESPIPAKTSIWSGALSLSKDIMPWLVLVANRIYGFGVKQSTSDRLQQQAISADFLPRDPILFLLISVPKVPVRPTLDPGEQKAK